MGVKDLSENLETMMIDVGESEGLANHDPLAVPFNFVLIHRHYEPVVQKWGNLCGKVMSRILVRAADEMPIRWYHKKLYNFCSKQYDKYGDYYRLLDNSFGTAETDGIWEEE